MNDRRLKKIGSNIKEYRIKNGLTQSQLATRMRSNSKRIMEIEAGNVNLYLTTIVKLCTCLNISMSEIFKEV